MIRLLAVVEAATVTGPAKNLLEFARTAREPFDGGEGVEVSLVTFHRSDVAKQFEGEAENEFVAVARRQGVDIAVLPERKRFDMRVVEMLRQVVNERQPDIVQTHHVKSHFVMRLSGAWRQHPWVAWHHAYTATDFKMHCYNQLDRWSLRAPEVVMTVNKPFVEDLHRLGVRRERLRVLHNQARIGWNAHVTPEDVAQLRQRLGIPEGDKVVLAVGRFSWEKGHIDLVHSFAALKREQPSLPVRLVLVGEGPERGALESACRESGITDSVIFAGHQSDVGPFFAMANVLALPSLGEGSPNVLLEAISANLPVVTTDVGGIPEMVVHEESALVLKARDLDAMTRYLGRVLTDENLARSLASNALIVAARYSPEARLSALLELYRGLARDKVKQPVAAGAGK